MIIQKKNNKINNKFQRKFKIKKRHIIFMFIITYFICTSFKEYDDLRYYKEELSYNIPISQKIDMLNYDELNTIVYKHSYQKEDIIYLLGQDFLKKIQTFQVKYYILDKFMYEEKQIPKEINTVIENTNNYYAFYENRCEYYLLILDVENMALYNMNWRCGGL